MDRSTIERLFSITGEFYRQQSSSFSASRNNSWPGWERAFSYLEKQVAQTCKVLDVACGNMRFERWLAASFPRVSFEVAALDSCDSMAADVPPFVRFDHFDIGAHLMGGTRGLPCASHTFDIAACFGFMHHVPTLPLRIELANDLVESLVPGGRAVMSFWRFADEESLRRKAIASTERAQLAHPDLHLEENDYLLGWDGDESVLRYCHSFSDDDIDAIVEGIEGARVLSRYDSDGRTGRLNAYLVLECS